METQGVGTEADIGAVLQERIAALRDRDAERLAALYALAILTPQRISPPPSELIRVGD